MYLIHQQDKEYNKVYREALKATQMEHTDSRHARFYNLIQFFNQTEIQSGSWRGSTAEAGCWRGLSSYLMLQTRQNRVGINDTHFIFDSFQGLSEPSEKDMGHYSVEEMKGRFSADLNTVSHNLRKFDKHIHYVPGWIPESFDNKYIAARYNFVHIDLELYKPTYAALNFFWERLNQNGIIVCDDCGYLSFPGSNRAMKDFCSERKLQPLFLTTGNGVLIKR